MAGSGSKGKWEASYIIDDEILELERAGYLSADIVHRDSKKDQNDDNESQDDAVEVISISSDSPSPSPKPARRVCGKVPMSHPNACLDPNFLLKKTQHASFRKTRRHSGDLVSGLPVKTPTKKQQNETSPPSSGDSVMSALPPMIHVQGAQAKKRKTGGSTSTPALELKENPAPARADPTKDISDDRVDLPSSPKEGMEAPNPPNPLKAAEDPDVVVITGTGFSKPTSAILSKHVSTLSHPSTGHEISMAKLSQYEKLEFNELCSGFASHLETSYEMEKNPLHMMKNKHEESLAQAESTLGDLKKSLADQQDAWAKAEEKYQVILADMEKLKAAKKKSQAYQATALKQAEMAETKLEAVQQELAGLKKHISNMTQAIFGPRAANLQDDCILKLKAIYTLTEQLYVGSMLTMKAVMSTKEPITSIKKMLGCLSTLPPQIGELT
ncbi:hypothetical protein ZWY2020_049950 [Hordeum vulgare]|nr:hypothetical protein ZWY2020_049950 [Hordeum vulgare]